MHSRVDVVERERERETGSLFSVVPAPTVAFTPYSLSHQRTGVPTPHTNNMLEGVRLERGEWGLPTPLPRSKAKQRERERERGIRAEARGTTVYASATLLLGDIEGISASQHRRCSQETLQVFPLIGVHMAETYMLSVAIVLKSPLGGVISK